MIKEHIKPVIKNVKPVFANNLFSSCKKSKSPLVFGASAGGLGTFEKKFENIPLNTRMAFAPTLHLNPHHTGGMPELIEPITTVKVATVTNRLTVKKTLIMLYHQIHSYCRFRQVIKMHKKPTNEAS